MQFHVNQRIQVTVRQVKLQAFSTFSCVVVVDDADADVCDGSNSVISSVVRGLC